MSKSFKYHFVSHRLAIYYGQGQITKSIYFQSIFEWFIDLCVMRIILFRLKGILIFHKVRINERRFERYLNYML